MIRELGLGGTETILDFGCGTGTLSLMIKQRYPSVMITGLDVDTDILFIAERKARQRGLDLSLKKYDGVHLPFNGQRPFDRVVSSLVFHHIPTAQKVNLLNQLYHNIQSGGKLLIADFGKPRSWYTKLAFAILRRFDGQENTLVNARGQLAQFVANAGFGSVEEFKAYNTLFGTVTLIQAVK